MADGLETPQEKKGILMTRRWFFPARGFIAAILLMGTGAYLATEMRGTQIAGAQPAAVAASLPAPAAVLPANFMNVHALIIVRHADIDVEKKATMGNDVPLLPRGDERAKELAYALKDAGITRIVTSTALRTKQTAAVLAKELNITPETPFEHHSDKPADQKPAGGSPIDYIADIGKPTDTVLLVYHHSVIPSLLKQLGDPGEPAFNDDTEFDRIYVVLPDPVKQTYRVLRLRYGGKWQPTP
jgi:phosphohistidine phosphatase SixA